MPYRVTRYRLLMVKDGSITTTWDRQVRQPRDVADFMAPLAANLDREHFWLLALDGKNRLMGLHVVSVGSLTAALVHRVLAMNAEGTERLVAETPFRLLGHWSSAAVTRRLKTASPLPATDELVRRQTALEDAIKEYPARRAEVLRRRGMLAPADFVVGDLTKGGRAATPAELEALSGRQSMNADEPASAGGSQELVQRGACHEARRSGREGAREVAGRGCKDPQTVSETVTRGTDQTGGVEGSKSLVLLTPASSSSTTP